MAASRASHCTSAKSTDSVTRLRNLSYIAWNISPTSPGHLDQSGDLLITLQNNAVLCTYQISKETVFSLVQVSHHY